MTYHRRQVCEIERLVEDRGSSWHAPASRWHRPLPSLARWHAPSLVRVIVRNDALALLLGRLPRRDEVGPRCAGARFRPLAFPRFRSWILQQVPARSADARSALPARSAAHGDASRALFGRFCLIFAVFAARYARSETGAHCGMWARYARSE